ncbi:MAG: hypothetical protein MUC59_07835 [Saprospiraceae bacterium]|jgi:hypothetical protein|nr:hypothetical protein [Saprospiraceae bacterium]
MNRLKLLLFLTTFAFGASTAFGQDKFSNCTAAYLNNKLVVNEYSPDGYCEVLKTASGELTVQTMDDTAPTGKTSFKIAIRDGSTKTLCSISDKTYREIPIERVLAKCKPGDAIVLLTTNDRYSLPHNEIWVKKTSLSCAR